MTPDDYCQKKAAQSGSSFYYAFLFLPPERRRAITALYAFCREVDDAVDEPSEASVARVRLAWWRDEVARLYAGKPEHPVTRALHQWQPHQRLHAGEINAPTLERVLVFERSCGEVGAVGGGVHRGSFSIRVRPQRAV